MAIPVAEISSQGSVMTTNSNSNDLSSPLTAVRSWLASRHPKELARLDRFEMELRLGRLSTSKGQKSTVEMSRMDRRQVTFRTVELLRTLVGNTKWKSPAQLMTLLRGIGRDLHAAGGSKEPAIENIVRRIMCAVRDEVSTAEANDAQAVGKSNASSDSMAPIDEDSDSISAKKSSKASLAANRKQSQGPSMSRNLSLASMLWAHPQHTTTPKIGSGQTSTKSKKRSDSFSSVDSSSDILNPNENEHDFPPSFYTIRPHFRPAVMEAIQEIMLDLEDIHTNIDSQGSAHIHAGEVILTYSRSKTVESFLKAAAKRRKFQVIVCEGAPDRMESRDAMAKSLAAAGIDTTVIHDSAVFAIMARVNKVLLPAHAVLANGGLIAPSGSHMVALAAAHNSVPLVCLTGMFKLCPMYPHEGQDTLQDLVSPSSIIDYAEMSDEIMTKVEFVNPVHDYIRPNLINLYVTNIGAFQPSYIYRLLAEYYHNDDWESFE